MFNNLFCVLYFSVCVILYVLLNCIFIFTLHIYIYMYIYIIHIIVFVFNSRLCPCSHRYKIIASQDVVVLQKSSEVGNTSRIDVASCGLNVILLMAELLHQLVW